MSVRILTGDCRKVLATLPDESVHCVVTSPPYWGLRDYGCQGQIGLEESFWDYLDGLVAVFREVHRVLRSDGIAWINMGDAYANDGKWGGATGGKHARFLHGGERRVGRERRRTGLKPKDLIGQPWRLAFALQDNGWWLRRDIIWHKPSVMPERVEDRCTTTHEYLFHLTKSQSYYYDAAAIAEPCAPTTLKDRVDTGARRPERGFPGAASAGAGRLGSAETRNRRSVWTIPTEPLPYQHHAAFPTALVEPCILAGCPAGGTVLDPFGGVGTTGLVANRLGRDAILIELSPEHAADAQARIAADSASPIEAARLRHAHKTADLSGTLFGEALPPTSPDPMEAASPTDHTPGSPAVPGNGA